MTAKKTPISDEVYEDASGRTMRRERGLTPSGNPIANRWVLRTPQGEWIDFDQYRNDLFEQYDFRPLRKEDT